MGVSVSTSNQEINIKTTFFLILLLTDPWLNKKRDCDSEGQQEYINVNSFIEAAKDLPQDYNEILNWLRSKGLEKADFKYNWILNYIVERNENLNDIYSTAKKFIENAALSKETAYVSY